MIKKYLPITLIIVGFIIIGIALSQRLMTIYYQNQFIKEYNLNKNDSEHKQEIGENIKDQNNIEIEENISSNEIDLPDSIINIEEQIITNDKKTDMEKAEIIGILNIPKININVAILEGMDNSALRYTVGHYPGTAMPGEVGNFVLLGHRNYRYGHFFRKLDKLNMGDKVIIDRDSTTYTYKITESFVVSPEDTWVLNPTLDAQITMITCTPIGTYTHRLIVKGILEN